MVLGRRPDHRRTADVDLLDALVDSAPEATVSLERVQVGHQQVERRDAELGELRGVRVRRRSASSPACTFGCSVFTRPSRHLREAGQLLDRGHRHAGRLDRRRGAAGGDDLHPGGVQRLGQLDQPGLVVDADQRPPDRAAPVARCGAHCDRDLSSGDRPAFADQPADLLDELPPLGFLDALGERLLVVVVEHRHRHLGDDRPGVHPGVDEEQGRPGDLHPVGEGVARAVDAGERRQQRVVRVEVAVAEGGEEVRADQLQEAGRDDQVGLVLGDARGERGVPVLRGRVVADRLDEGRHPGGGGAVEARDAVPVRADRDHLAPYAGSAVASSSAWRLLPEPETRTTIRAAWVTGTPYPAADRGPSAGRHGIARQPGWSGPGTLPVA